MASQGAPQERNQDATLYVGELDTLVTEELLWELFLQCGPVAHVHIPMDRVLGTHNGYGFVEFKNESDVDYAVKILSGINLFGRPIRVNKAAQGGKKAQDVGANLFVGGLSPDVDENILEQTFRIFGSLIQTPKIMRDETGASRGFGFVNFDSFEASDAALQAMNQQWLGGRQINASYAFKKDNKSERHGDAAERRLAALNQQSSGRPPSSAVENPQQVLAMMPHMQGGQGGAGRGHPHPDMGGPPMGMPGGHPPHGGRGGGHFGTGANMAPMPHMRPNVGRGGPPPPFPPPPGGFPPQWGGGPPRGMPPPPGGLPPPPGGLPPPPGGFAPPPGGMPPPPGGFAPPHMPPPPGGMPPQQQR